MDTAIALAALRALSHEARLGAFRQLVQAGPAGLSVGELRAHLQLPPATLSAHLNVLRAAGLVEDQREGRVIRVRAHYPRMNALLAYLTEHCCAGTASCGPLAEGVACVPGAGTKAAPTRPAGARPMRSKFRKSP